MLKIPIKLFGFFWQFSKDGGHILTTLKEFLNLNGCDLGADDKNANEKKKFCDVINTLSGP